MTDTDTGKTIISMCSVEASGLAMQLTPLVISTAIESMGIEIPAPDVAVLVTVDEQSGWRAMTLVDVYEIDAMILFGKTAISVGLGDVEQFEVTSVVLPGGLRSVPALRLPSPLSSVWHHPATIARAAFMCRLLLANDSPKAERLAAGAHLWS